MAKSKAQEISRQYYQKNKEKKKAQAHAWRKANPDKVRENNAKWRKDNSDYGVIWGQLNPEKSREYQKRYQPKRTLYARARKYGMTAAQLEKFIADRDGRCEACGGKGEHVDHDHKTGNVRGLLCARCNHTIGHSKEDINRLLGVAAYLERSMAEKVLATALRKGGTLHKTLDARVGDGVALKPLW